MKIWSRKPCQKMKTLLCLTNLMQRVPEGIKRKIALGNMKIKIMVSINDDDNSDTDYTDEDDEDQHYSRKMSNFYPCHVFLTGAHSYVDAYKILSMKVYNIQ